MRSLKAYGVEMDTIICMIGAPHGSVLRSSVVCHVSVIASDYLPLYTDLTTHGSPTE